jgi:drug/metabolite transporter (DMT)-like permease
MRSGILFALVSLAFAGFLDVSYKVFANRGLSRGCFLSAMGIVWLVLQAALLAGTEQPLTLSSASWLFGLTAGVAVTLSNLAFIESMTVLNVSLSSTVYRLNTIGVMVLGLVFLGESVSLLNFAGIGLGIAAVLLLYQRTPGTDQEATSRAVLFFGIAVFASAARATFGVLTKAGLNAGADATSLLLIAALCWAVGGIVYALVWERGLRFTPKGLGYSLLAGLLVFGTVNSLIAALASADATLVIPIANLSFLVALSVGVGLRLEVLTRQKIMAMVLAVFAIWALSASG